MVFVTDSFGVLTSPYRQLAVAIDGVLRDYAEHNLFVLDYVNLLNRNSDQDETVFAAIHLVVAGNFWELRNPEAALNDLISEINDFVDGELATCFNKGEYEDVGYTIEVEPTTPIYRTQQGTIIIIQRACRITAHLKKEAA